jgi:hypothetical protein
MNLLIFLQSTNCNAILWGRILLMCQFDALRTIETLQRKKGSQMVCLKPMHDLYLHALALGVDTMDGDLRIYFAMYLSDLYC